MPRASSSCQGCRKTKRKKKAAAAAARPPPTPSPPAISPPPAPSPPTPSSPLPTSPVSVDILVISEASHKDKILRQYGDYFDQFAKNDSDMPFPKRKDEELTDEITGTSQSKNEIPDLVPLPSLTIEPTKPTMGTRGKKPKVKAESKPEVPVVAPAKGKTRLKSAVHVAPAKVKAQPTTEGSAMVPAKVDIELMPAQSIADKLTGLMKEGSLALIGMKYKVGSQRFCSALELLRLNPLLAQKYSEEDVVLLKYCYAKCCVYLHTSEDICVGHKILDDIAEAHPNISFPLVYYLKGVGYVAQNRFKEATEPLEKLTRIMKKKIVLRPYIYPEAPYEEVLEESVTIRLEVLLDNLLDICKNAPSPDAVCRHNDCDGHVRANIYFTDPGFVGFVQVACHDRCRVQFHVDCWTDYLAGKHITRNKAFLGTPCMTPDCKSVVTKISVVGPDGETRKEFVFQVGERKTQKEKVCVGKVPIQRHSSVKNEPKQGKKKLSRSTSGSSSIGDKGATAQTTPTLNESGGSGTKSVECAVVIPDIRLNADRDIKRPVLLPSTMAHKPLEKKETAHKIKISPVGTCFSWEDELESNQVNFQTVSQNAEEAEEAKMQTNDKPIEVEAGINIEEFDHSLEKTLLEYIESYIRANGPTRMDCPLFFGDIALFPAVAQDLLYRNGTITRFVSHSSELEMTGSVVLLRDHYRTQKITSDSVLCALDLAVKGRQAKPNATYRFASLPNLAISLLPHYQNQNETPKESFSSHGATVVEVAYVTQANDDDQGAAAILPDCLSNGVKPYSIASDDSAIQCVNEEAAERMLEQSSRVAEVLGDHCRQYAKSEGDCLHEEGGVTQNHPSGDSAIQCVNEEAAGWMLEQSSRVAEVLGDHCRQYAKSEGDCLLQEGGDTQNHHRHPSGDSAKLPIVAMPTSPDWLSETSSGPTQLSSGRATPSFPNKVHVSRAINILLKELHYLDDVPKARICLDLQELGKRNLDKSIELFSEEVSDMLTHISGEYRTSSECHAEFVSNSQREYKQLLDKFTEMQSKCNELETEVNNEKKQTRILNKELLQLSLKAEATLRELNSKNACISRCDQDKKSLESQFIQNSKDIQDNIVIWEKMKEDVAQLQDTLKAMEYNMNSLYNENFVLREVIANSQHFDGQKRMRKSCPVDISHSGNPYDFSLVKARSSEAPALPAPNLVKPLVKPYPPDAFYLTTGQTPIPVLQNPGSQNAKCSTGDNPSVHFKNVSDGTMKKCVVGVMRSSFPDVGNLAVGSSSVYDRILKRLESEFPLYNRDKLSEFISTVRGKNGGSLTGMPVTGIVESVRHEIFFDLANKYSKPKKVCPENAIWQKPKPGVVPCTLEAVGEECAICTEDINVGETDMLVCKHIFHKKCIKIWYIVQETCPVCRTYAPLVDDYPPLPLQ